MSRLAAAPLLLPLAAAGLSLVMWRRLWWQRLLGLGASATALAAAVALLAQVEREGIQVVRVGGWPPPAGITLVADRFSAAMLVVSTLMSLAVLLYAVGQGGTDERNPFFHPVYQVLGAGVAGAFLTGDLFNLFVSFEVMLTASYVLITYRARSHQVRAVTSYV
ncbi:MAG: Na+/H+ antiporter subunit D, partial [Actinobacteria bacterium]|nr:Na+/H+ antiporter subunit D [Actinomycetota bacterium]